MRQRGQKMCQMWTKTRTKNVPNVKASTKDGCMWLNLISWERKYKFYWINFTLIKITAIGHYIRISEQLKNIANKLFGKCPVGSGWIFSLKKKWIYRFCSYKQKPSMYLYLELILIAQNLFWFLKKSNWMEHLLAKYIF